MKIDGKNIVLTGASSGIGLEVLKILSRYDGARIVAVAHGHIENIPRKEASIFPFSADLGTQEGVDSVFDYAQSVLGDIDIFIANAGIAYMEKPDKPDWEHIENIFSLNVFSPVYSLEKLLQKKNGRRVFFACTSSAIAIVPLPYYSLYTSTKSALRLFFDTYRYEKDADVHIMTIFPIATRTSIFDRASKKANTPLPFFQQEPQTVAQAIVKGIEKDKTKVYPSFLFRLFYIAGHIFPFLFRLYSWNEKKKAEKYLA